LIQNLGVRHSLLTHLVQASFALSIVGCAHAHEETMAPRTVNNEVVTETTEREREVLAVDRTPVVEAPVQARPRLSQTVTLGQGTESQYTPSAPPPPAAAAPGVVVNNNIVVNGGAPAYYGGYAGYGGYGGRGGYGRPTTFYEGGRGPSYRSGQAWGATGWEGARRTAAPGQTPAVGGNWAPAPSYGPAQMK
jgi:hypothetical protein